MSPIIFVLELQLLLKATENNVDIVKIGGGFQMPPVKAFMDDTTILSAKKSTTHKILSLKDKQGFDPRLSNPVKMRKKCCYGRKKNFGSK